MVPNRAARARRTLRTREGSATLGASGADADGGERRAAMTELVRQVRGFGRDVKLFLLYSLLANVGFGVYGLIYNLYLTELDLREDFIGAFSAVQTLAMAGMAAAIGPMLGRFGTWRCIFGGIAGFLVASFGLALAESPAVLLALSAVFGIGLAFLFTATMPFVIEHARADQRQHVAAVSFSLISLAATIGSLLGGFLPELVASDGIGRYRAALLAGTTIGSLSLIPLLLMGDARRGTRRQTVAAPVESADERRQVRRDMTVFIGIGGLMALGAGAVMPFYNVYLTTRGASAREVGYVFAAGGLVAATLGLTAPAISRRFGSIQAVAGLRLSILPFYLLLILTPGTGLAVLAHLIRQTSISMAWPIDSTFIAEVLPARARATVFGLRSAAWNVGFSAASLAGGAVIVRRGYDATFVALIVFSTISAALFVVYFGRHPRVRAGEIPGALPRRRPGRTAPAPESRIGRQGVGGRR